MEHPISNPSATGTLPSYKNPPVNEVICGMRFHTPDKLNIPHIGLLWDKFRQEYPIIQHAPPVSAPQGEILIDNATGLPLPRVWFINDADNQLIQFQFDRFYFNWRRREDVYPRYTHVITSFERVLNSVEEFFNEFKLGELKPIEYELAYVNQIQKGQGWNTIDDLPKIFSDFVWGKTTGRFLPNPVNVAWQADFPLPQKRGHLTVNLKQATRTADKVPLLVFELATRGSGESTSKGAMREWFDTAHEWIVRGFTDLTTPEVQRDLWEREEDA
jgi:uncharacterized protein (TIGR04255 family)